MRRRNDQKQNKLRDRSGHIFRRQFNFNIFEKSWTKAEIELLTMGQDNTFGQQYNVFLSDFFIIQI